MGDKFVGKGQERGFELLGVVDCGKVHICRAGEWMAGGRAGGGGRANERKA